MVRSSSGTAATSSSTGGTAFASPAELRAAFALAYRTGTIGRALAWHRYFSHAPEERDDTVAYGLKMFLANGPIGSWEP